MFFNKKKDLIFNKDIKEIIILGGMGCVSCEALYNNVKIALKELNETLEPIYIKDTEKVLEYGIMTVPGLVINGKVVSVGKSLSVGKIKEILCQKI